MKSLSHLETFAVIALVAVGLVSTNMSAASVAHERCRQPRKTSSTLVPAHPYCDSVPWLAVSAAGIGLVGIRRGRVELLRRKRCKLAYEIALEHLENTRPLMREFHAEAFPGSFDVVREFIEEVLLVRAMRRTTRRIFA